MQNGDFHMKIKFGDVKPIKDEKPPIVGSFSVEKTPISWYKCREQFASFFNNDLESFFFSHPIGLSEHIAAFISKTEDVLNLTYSFKRTSFCKTNRPYALWVSPAPFWRECFLRRSLFTILLRCGFEYRENENNYEQALYSVPYIGETKTAVHRFLFGFTRFAGEKPAKSGWRDFFRNQNQENIVKMLVLPDKLKVERTMLGLGAIWN